MLRDMLASHIHLYPWSFLAWRYHLAMTLQGLCAPEPYYQLCRLAVTLELLHPGVLLLAFYCNSFAFAQLLHPCQVLRLKSFDCLKGYLRELDLLLPVIA